MKTLFLLISLSAVALAGSSTDYPWRRDGMLLKPGARAVYHRLGGTYKEAALKPFVPWKHDQSHVGFVFPIWPRHH